MDLPNDKKDDAPKEKIILQVIFTNEGQIKVIGSMLQDKIAAYGILEQIKDMVRDMHKPQLVKPQGSIMNFVRNGK